MGRGCWRSPVVGEVFVFEVALPHALVDAAGGGAALGDDVAALQL